MAMDPLSFFPIWLISMGVPIFDMFCIILTFTVFMSYSSLFQKIYEIWSYDINIYIVV